jgi:hypothetical protein
MSVRCPAVYRFAALAPAHEVSMKRRGRFIAATYIG